MLPTRSHLHRLPVVHRDAAPVFFVTTCTFGRRPILARPPEAAVVRETFEGSWAGWGWRIGRYVIMPNHIHFFCSPGDPTVAGLSALLRRFKSLTASRLGRLGHGRPVWQAEFFDHLLRHGESYQEKWDYVRNNPVRAGLVQQADEWPFQGEIDDIPW